MTLSMERKEQIKRVSIAVGLAAALLTGWIAVGAPSRTETALAGPTGGHYPANKVVVSGASFERASTPVTEGASSEEMTLFSTMLRTSKTADLLFTVSLECSIFTTVTTLGNQKSEATATIKVWIEIDGRRVPVSSPEEAEPGKVVFCDRTHQQEVAAQDDEDLQLKQFLRTRSANSFGWAVVNAGSGIHTVEVKAEVAGNVPGPGAGEAYGVIGKRTLLIEPVKMSNSETVNDL